ncbi:hypothetical protein N0A02_03265 [Paraburkholderia acidicola]|uniref:Uncharacterized protein n=1 Tax=Paraburkholderia acidicola TaxID=1912599 RepID=A0ABV1LGP8_9BURK
MALDKVAGESYCGAHRLPAGKTAAKRMGTRTSCQSGSEIVRRSTTSVIHGIRALFDVADIVDISIAAASKKVVKSDPAIAGSLSLTIAAAAADTA